MAFDPIGFALSKVGLLVGEDGVLRELRVDTDGELEIRRPDACPKCRGRGMVCGVCGSVKSNSSGDCVVCGPQGNPGTYNKCGDCAGTGRQLPPDMCRNCLGSGETCWMCSSPVVDGVCTGCDSAMPETCYVCGGTGISSAVACEQCGGKGHVCAGCGKALPSNGICPDCGMEAGWTDCIICGGTGKV